MPTAGWRQRAVRRSWDLYRAVEQIVLPTLSRPPLRSPRAPIATRAPGTEARIALTFDDGPHPENTPRLLEILRSRGIRATFYLIGERVAAFPDVARFIFSEGHEIGTHTWSHRFLTLQTTRSVATELRKAHDVIEGEAGTAPLTLRPPYGATTKALSRWIAYEFGYPTILWSVDARDWELPGAEVVAERLVAGSTPGSILLAHDPLSGTVDAMPETLDRLLQAGFRLGMVSELVSVDESG